MIGATGLAIGLAFQGALSNFAAGAMLLVFRPFKVGDFVEIAGQTETVFALDLITNLFLVRLSKIHPTILPVASMLPWAPIMLQPWAGRGGYFLRRLAVSQIIWLIRNLS